jgi:hypothetical protein
MKQECVVVFVPLPLDFEQGKLNHITTKEHDKKYIVTDRYTDGE